MRSVTWQELVIRCSRIHGNAEMLDVVLNENSAATVVPTRMHHPGFYVRSRNEDEYWNMRTDDELRLFREWVDGGEVLLDDDSP